MSENDNSHTTAAGVLAQGAGELVGVAKNAVAKAFYASMRAAMGGFPTNAVVIDLTLHAFNLPDVPGLKSANVTVLEEKYNSARGCLQGKLLTDQPYGPRGGPSGSIAIQLVPFTKPGALTILLSTAGKGVVVAGNTVIYAPPGATHFGVKVTVEQLLDLAFVLPDLAAAAMWYAYTPDFQSGFKLTRQVAGCVGLGGPFPTAVVHVTMTPAASGALENLSVPEVCMLGPDYSGTNVVRISGGSAVIGNVYYRCDSLYLYVAANRDSISKIYVSRGTVVSTLQVDGSFPPVLSEDGNCSGYSWKLVQSRKPVFVAKF